MSVGAPVKVVVTGFGPFPGVPENATEHLVRHLENRQMLGRLATWADTQLHFFVLPVDWRTAPAIAAHILERHRPDAVLHFGVASRCSGFEIETEAHNWHGGKRDHFGAAALPSRLKPGSAPFLKTTAPAHHFRRRLQVQGFPAKLSRNAGAYLCNAVFFASLSQIREGYEPLVSFIHVPTFLEPMQNGGLGGMDDLVRGAELLISEAVQTVLRARQADRRARIKRQANGPQKFYRGRRLWRGPDRGYGGEGS